MKRAWTWAGIMLMRLARYCLGKGCKRCWICGRAVGMGTISRQGMWCDACYGEWKPYDRPRDGIVCDWRGLGRHVAKGKDLRLCGQSPVLDEFTEEEINAIKRAEERLTKRARAGK